jgi:hypothetical protein
MNKYVITFGRAGIRNGYVVVEAYGEDIVRAWAHREYGLCWSMVYTAEEFFEFEHAVSLGFSKGSLTKVPITLAYQQASHV